MKILRRYGILSCVLAFVFFAAGSVESDEIADLNAQEIVRQIETQYQGETSHTIMIMNVVTEAWSRKLRMEAWSEGRDKFLATILSPKKEAGTATLKINDDMWNYLPRIDRLMKIPSSLMGDSWMGSHLTNDDLVKENKIDELYTLEIERIEGQVVTISCTPKPDAAIVWGRVVYQADMAKKIPITIDYYDEDGELVRTMSFDRVERISGRWIPLRMSVRPVEEPDEKTELVYESLEFDVTLPKDLFSVQSLRRR